MILLALALAVDITCTPQTLKAADRKAQPVHCFAVMDMPTPRKATCVWVWGPQTGENRSEAFECGSDTVRDAFHRFKPDLEKPYPIEFMIYGDNSWLLAEGIYVLRTEDR